MFWRNVVWSWGDDDDDDGGSLLAADLRRTPDSAPDTDLNPPLLSPRCPSGPPPQLDSKTELSTARLQSAPQPWSNWTSSVPALFSSCSPDPRFCFLSYLDLFYKRSVCWTVVLVRVLVLQDNQMDRQVHRI
ncbi:hypothetical protein INR49_023186 [Caranx melampygus]|nr:hypothetical protein INR49_023186 [Caranx melampygus]